MVSRAEAEALRSAGPPYQVRVLVSQIPELIDTVLALYERVEELQRLLDDEPHGS
jgi:hypothetical protein